MSHLAEDELDCELRGIFYLRRQLTYLPRMLSALALGDLSGYVRIYPGFFCLGH